MAVKTTTTYACDGCGKATKKPSDLRRFTLTERTLSASAKEIVAEAKTDLCVACEQILHETTLAGLWPKSESEKMAGYVRG